MLCTESNYQFGFVLFCFKEKGYLAMLSQIPWPPNFAVSTGAPGFRTMIFKVRRLPFMPATSSRL